MKKSAAQKIFDTVNILIMLFIVCVTVYPILYTLAVSFSDEGAILSGKVTFFPIDATLNAYEKIVVQENFWIGYKNTIVYSVIGTVIGMFMMTLCAYPLTKKFLPGQSFFNKMITITMFFSGGIIPNYLLVVSLGMRNTIWSIVLPGAISVWNMTIMRTFFSGIPESLEEAAAVDGLNPLQTLIKIILPLSTPMLSTMALFTIVYYWNSWFPALIYLDSNDKYPVTIFLRNIINGAQVAVMNPNVTAEELLNQPAESLKSAAIILTALPILCVYPFVQKYFVQGMMIGSVKE